MIAYDKVVAEQKESVLTIHIAGCFGYKLIPKFRNAYKGLIAGARIRIDLERVYQIESAALGALMVMRNALGGEMADIQLVNPSREVRTILELSQYHRVFKIISTQ
ncbi:MAG: STAS domain-containing protein [Magnetococcales bacterium]|nr:STAS domain-containing protein [Magnetococcales bacterium]